MANQDKDNNKEIPEERVAMYYIGNVIVVIGVIMCFGFVFSGMMSVGRNSSPFQSTAPESPAPFIIGMVMCVVGSVLRGIGAVGLTGTGVILDPKKQREEQKPWSKMQGGMLSDALEEVDVTPLQNVPEVVKIRCKSCRALNNEQARFCDQCGKAL